MIVNNEQCTQLTKVIHGIVAENPTILESFPFELIGRASKVAAHNVVVKRLPSHITERYVAECKNCESTIVLTVSKFPMSKKKFYDYYHNNIRSFSLVLEFGFIKELVYNDRGSDYLIPVCKKLEAFL